MDGTLSHSLSRSLSPGAAAAAGSIDRTSSGYESRDWLSIQLGHDHVCGERAEQTRDDADRASFQRGPVTLHRRRAFACHTTSNKLATTSK